jgi:hypothetical protein
LFSFLNILFDAKLQWIVFSKLTKVDSQNCESFAIQEYSMIPKPKCRVETDPNKHILILIEIQVIILFVLIVIISGFVLIHIKNIWVKTKPETYALDSNKKGIKSWIWSQHQRQNHKK